MTAKKTLLCIVGPTASGKTSLAIKLAKHFKTEIISADSRQFYKELAIGTAKPSNEELAVVPHHFISNKGIAEIYSAGDFEVDAIRKINELFIEHDIVVLAGGSGMYIDAVCKGFDYLPKVDAAIREEIIERYKSDGISFLQGEIRMKDADYFKTVDTQNPQRLMRALEVIYATGKPFSKFRKQNSVARNFNILTLGLQWEREKLYNRINTRVDEMIAAGLEKEARDFIGYREMYALRTVGYSEFFDYFDGKQDLKTTIDLIKQHTRNFAKRQYTWFKRDANIQWIDAGNEMEIFAFINLKLNNLFSEHD